MDHEGFPTAVAPPGRVAISVGPRARAFVVDALATAVGVVVVGVGFAIASDRATLPSSWWFAATPTLAFVYFVVCERLGGRTLGKRAFGIEIRAVTGETIGLRAALVRNLVRFVDLALLPVSVVLVAFSPRHRSLGDRAAGTVVVSSRVNAPDLVSDGTHALGQAEPDAFNVAVQSEIGRPPPR